MRDAKPDGEFPGPYACGRVSAEPTPPSVSVVIVTYRQGEAVRPTLDTLAQQLRAGDELIVVDNGCDELTQRVAAEAAPQARVMDPGANLGFPAACNRAAAEARCDLLVFLNPDAVPAPGWRDAIAAPVTDGSGWAAWQALVTAEGGRIVNSRGGVVHFTGIAWAGGAGEPVPEAREPLPSPGFASGACLAIPRRALAEAGGFADDFFLYHEDVELSLRLRLGGGALGVAGGARVDHDYEFDKGPEKWRRLERNRWATVIRTYPAALLALLAPALAATELTLLIVAALNGWLPQKLTAAAETLHALPLLLRERREIQRRRSVSAAEFARGLTAGLDSPYLGAAAGSAALGRILVLYWRAVLRLLGA